MSKINDGLVACPQCGRESIYLWDTSEMGVKIHKDGDPVCAVCVQRHFFYIAHYEGKDIEKLTGVYSEQ